MTDQPHTLSMSREELIILANALNYMAHAISAGECSTLIGQDQAAVKSLHGKVASHLKRGG